MLRNYRSSSNMSKISRPELGYKSALEFLQFAQFSRCCNDAKKNGEKINSGEILKKKLRVAKKKKFPEGTLGVDTNMLSL